MIHRMLGGCALPPAALAAPLRASLEVLSPGYLSDYSEDEATNLLSRDEVVLEVDLAAGQAEATTWTCDLSKEYVAINADYRT